MSDKNKTEGKNLFGDFIKKLAAEIDWDKLKRIVRKENIKFPIEFASINTQVRFKATESMRKDMKPGDLVSIRICGDQFDNKTFLGMFVGSLVLDVAVGYDPVDKEISITGNNNPAFLVPEIQQVIFGAESFWSPITSKEQLRKITDKDIDNTWYIKALKELDE